ncbi:hypothetical protein GCM10009665_73510 [Kitasatospora nipponensis]|uniref:HTH luxR-type domain-containing protein n=1 Tax=Kitasatospora nipponensis TaxID=258049 RepID=A0ABN1X0M6_9ACTN
MGSVGPVGSAGPVEQVGTVAAVDSGAPGGALLGEWLGDGSAGSAADAPADGLVEELSEAERRVAELAAHGLSNREVARKLYITVSTVEQHLTRVYRKLGVRRRVDLGRRLALGRGLPDSAPGDGPLLLAATGRGTTGVA